MARAPFLIPAPRCWLATDGMGTAKKATSSASFRSVEKGIMREDALKILRDGGQLRLSALLRGRVRHFADGMALGSRDLIEDAFSKRRAWFGTKRRTGGSVVAIGGKGARPSLFVESSKTLNISIDLLMLEKLTNSLFFLLLIGVSSKGERSNKAAKSIFGRIPERINGGDSAVGDSRNSVNW